MWASCWPPSPSVASPAPTVNLSFHCRVCSSGLAPAAAHFWPHSSAFSWPSLLHTSTHDHIRPLWSPWFPLLSVCLGMTPSRKITHSWPWFLLPCAYLQLAPTTMHPLSATPGPAYQAHLLLDLQALLTTPTTLTFTTNSISYHQPGPCSCWCHRLQLPSCQVSPTYTWSCHMPLNLSSCIQLELVP